MASFASKMFLEGFDKENSSESKFIEQKINDLLLKVDELMRNCRALEDENNELKLTLAKPEKITEIFCDNCVHVSKTLSSEAFQTILNHPKDRILISSKTTPKDLLTQLDNLDKIWKNQMIKFENRREKFEIVGLKTENIKLMSQIRCMCRKTQYLKYCMANLERIIVKITNNNDETTWSLKGLTHSEQTWIKKILVSRERDV